MSLKNQPENKLYTGKIKDGREFGEFGFHIETPKTQPNLVCVNCDIPECRGKAPGQACPTTVTDNLKK